MASFLLMEPAFAARPTPTPETPEYSVTVIPNPVRGKKVSFRFQVDRPVFVKVRVYDRFLDVVEEFEKEGEKLFDILWIFKKVPEGIYYFQAHVTDLGTEEVTPLPIQKFVILRGDPKKD